MEICNMENKYSKKLTESEKLLKKFFDTFFKGGTGALLRIQHVGNK